MQTRQPTAKIDERLARLLDGLKDEEDVAVLLYPHGAADRLREYIDEQQRSGVLQYNASILKMAGCFAVRAPKRMIRELAGREDVDRIAENPSFRAT